MTKCEMLFLLSWLPKKTRQSSKFWRVIIHSCARKMIRTAVAPWLACQTYLNKSVISEKSISTWVHTCTNTSESCPISRETSRLVNEAPTTRGKCRPSWRELQAATWGLSTKTIQSWTLAWPTHTIAPGTE